MMDYLYIALAWLVYLFLHSLLASGQVKSFFSPGFPYRFLYAVFSIVGLLVLIWWMAVIPARYLFPVIAMTKYAGMVLAIWGVLLVKASFRHLSLRVFLGLSHQKAPQPLVKTGIYAYVRHPIYSGTILIMLGMFLAVPSYTVLIAFVCISSYLPMGIYYEEQKLISEFGDDYRVYRWEVKAVIPGLL